MVEDAAKPSVDPARKQAVIDNMSAARGGDGHVSPVWVWAIDQDPDFVEAYAEFMKTAYVPDYDRELPAHVREIINIVVLAMRGFHWTLPAHMRRAFDLGATTQEILEGLQAAVIPGGAPVAYLGMEALKQVVDERNAET